MSVFSHCFLGAVSYKHSHQREHHTTGDLPNCLDNHYRFTVSSYLISKLHEIPDLLFHSSDKFQVFSEREDQQRGTLRVFSTLLVQ